MRLRRALWLVKAASAAALVLPPVGARRRAQQATSVLPEWDTALAQSLASQKRCSVSRVPAGEMTRERFDAEFRGVRPVVIEGLVHAERWPATERWQKQQLVDRVGDRTALIRRKGEADKVQQKNGEGGSRAVSLREWISMAFDSRERLRNTNYQIDKHFMAEQAPELLEDFDAPAALASLTQAAQEPGSEQPFFYLGPRGSGIGFHRHGEAWNAVVFGRKRWLFFPPAWCSGVLGVMHDASLDGAGWLRTFGEVLEGTETAPIECETAAGDVMYVPASWHHATINTMDTIGVFRNHEPQHFGQAVSLDAFHWRSGPEEVLAGASAQTALDAERDCAGQCLAEKVHAGKVLLVGYVRAGEDSVGVTHFELLSESILSKALRGIEMLEGVAANEPNDLQLSSHETGVWACGVFVLGLARIGPGPHSNKKLAYSLIQRALVAGYAPVGWKEHVAAIEAIAQGDSEGTPERDPLLLLGVELCDAAVALESSRHGVHVYTRAALLATQVRC